MYARIKSWYDKGIWSESQVFAAVLRGWITESQAAEIVGT